MHNVISFHMLGKQNHRSISIDINYLMCIEETSNINQYHSRKTR
jgi:hypothetical protein